MRKVFLLFALTLLMSSCATSYFQVYKVESDLKESNEEYVYEDEVCKLTYNLWESNKNFYYLFENKTNRDIYINLFNCFVLKNGVAYDCYTDRESTFRVGISAATSNVVRQSAMIQYTDKQMPVVTIPAGAKKIIYTNQELMDRIIYVCDSNIDFPTEETEGVFYSKDSSPLVFVNRIAYSFDKDATEYDYINNEFWISSYFNNSSSQTLIDYSHKDCHTGLKVYEKVNKYISGIRLYNNYKH